MRRILSISWLAAALACGSVDDRQACSTSTQCPVGQYCAHAEGESRCWADATAPVVQSVTASCAQTPCLRDGVLHVEATVTDDAEVLDAAVSLDLAPGTPVAMTRSGSKWVADVQLRAFPFRAFARDVVASVVARDGARNPSVAKGAPAIAATRLRWQRAVDLDGAVLTPTSPAVKQDGTAVVGGSNGKLYFVAANGSDAHSPLAVGMGQISAAPAIGANTIWVGSEDFSLYGIDFDGGAPKPNVTVNTTGAVQGSVAVLPGTTKECGFATSDTGFVGVASTVANDNDRIGPSAAFSVGPVVGSDGTVYAITGSGTVRAYTLSTSPVVTLADAWNASVGFSVSAPPAVDGDGAIWTGSLDGRISRTVPAAKSAEQVASVSAPVLDSLVILSNGDIVVGDQTGVLHRLNSAGAAVWTAEPNLGSAIRAPVALAGGEAALLVPSGGKVFALRDDGTEVWSAALDTGNTLRAPNIYTPPNQTSNVMSTVYVASSSGKLFAVIVDGQLDAAAPWPKAFHDPRNTNRAGPQP